MGVKQGCPLSPTLFGLCIDELEEVVNAPKLMQHVILLLYGYDVVLFSYDVYSTQNLHKVLEEFCQCMSQTYAMGSSVAIS